MEVKIYPETVKKMREYHLAEEIERLKKLKDEGKTREQIWELRNQSIFFEEDMKEVFPDEKKEITEDENEKIEIKNYNKFECVYLKDEDLLDYEDQPFENDIEEDNRELEESIKLNGIIEPIVVRRYKGKYQILSGHRRRMCGRNIGMKEFPCFICEKNDNEAKVYLVDTNLISRKFIKPMERARAYLMRKEALEAENELYKKHNVREKLIEEKNISSGNIQRYLRLNYLNKDFQKAVNEKKINLKVAEHLSFLKEEEQNQVFQYINEQNLKISEGQAKKIKNNSKENKFNNDVLSEIFKEKKSDREILTVRFLKEELQEYFNDLKNVNSIKTNILKGLKRLKDAEEIDSP